jgi:hypothetical protein
MTGLLVCCLHQASGFDHRFRDDLTSKVPQLRFFGQCEPGTSSDDGCNVCVCSARGMWMCTMRHCDNWSLFPGRFSSSRSKDVPIVDNIPGAPAPSLVREKRSPISIGTTTILVRNTAECPTRSDVGKPFQDGCRACRCMAANLAGCSTASCGGTEETTTTIAPEVTEEVTHEEHGLTTPTPTPEAITTIETIERVTPIPPSVFCETYRDIGMRYFDGCNRCRCFGIGRARCTRRACPVIRRVTPTPASEVCATERDIGKIYFDGCNWCKCFSLGNAACTYRACPVIRSTTPPPTKISRIQPTPPSEVCKTTEDIGKRYFDGCNRCRCTRIGGAACTKRACPVIRPTIPSPVTTVKRETKRRRVRPRPASEVCKTAGDVGRSYYDGCNRCHCMGIGRAGCGRRMCPFLNEQTTRTTVAPTTPAPSGFCTSWADIGRHEYDGCNHCMCTRGLRKICTMRHCLPTKLEV